MITGRKTLPVGKISLLIVLLLVGLVVGGCTGISSSPAGGSGAAVAEGTIFLSPSLNQSSSFSCSATTAEGKLVAINTETGVQRWEVELTGATSSGGFGCSSSTTPVAVYGSPALYEDLVYVAGYNGKVYAINAESGALRWVYPTEGYIDSIVGGVVVAEDKLYFTCADGKVYALDAVGPELLWEFATESKEKIWSTPAYDSGTLYVASFDKKLYAINAADGTLEWEFEGKGAFASTPLVDNGTVYIGSLDRYFYAINAADGEVKWEFQAEKWFWTRALAFEDTIYVGCFDGKVYVLDAASGEEITTAFDLESPVRSWPVLVEDRVLIATEDGRIYTIDAVNNQLGLFADLEETIYAPLALSEGVLYVYTQERNIHAFNTDTGVKMWVQSVD